MKLSEAIRTIGGDISGIDPALPDRDVEGFAVDSREVKAGDVFFALSQPDYRNNGFNGDFDDATRFAAAALRAGAALAVVRRDRFEEHIEELREFSSRILLVDDAIAALQRLARGVYERWGGPVIAITGSAGKTTARELTAHVIASSGRKVLKNIKNYNNGIGHPLTVLELCKDPGYDIAVLEMGMSTPMNEIARLCRITPPDVAVELCVLPVHIEHLGSIDRIAQAKAELVEGMKPGGTAILNADDTRVALMAGLANGRVVTFGIDSDADFRAEDIQIEGFGRTRFRITTPDGGADVVLPLIGRHNVMNALAAVAASSVIGISMQAAAEALRTAGSPSQRGEILHFAAGFTVINDSYNSNPDALVSMAETLVAASPRGARKIVVAGEMLELGDLAREAHIEAGRRLAAAGIDRLIAVRGNAVHLADGAREAGLTDVELAEDSDMAAEILSRSIKAGDVILVKGSRGVRTEKVLERLLREYELEVNAAAVRN